MGYQLIWWAHSHRPAQPGDWWGDKTNHHIKYEKKERMNSISRHKHLIVNSGLLVITLVYIFRDPGEPSQDITETQTPEKLSQKLKRILYWNDYYGSKNFGFCCGRGPYIKHKCPTSLCYTSKDRWQDLESFDAIVFHGRSLNPQDLPAVRWVSVWRLKTTEWMPKLGKLPGADIWLISCAKIHLLSNIWYGENNLMDFPSVQSRKILQVLLT